MSVEAWGLGNAQGKGFNMRNNRKCTPPGTNRGVTYTLC